MRLPRTFQVLAMTKTEVPDESGNYKNLEVKNNKCSCGSLDPQGEAKTSPLRPKLEQN
jgi:hypothetical protein